MGVEEKESRRQDAVSSVLAAFMGFSMTSGNTKEESVAIIASGMAALLELGVTESEIEKSFGDMSMMTMGGMGGFN